jgi:energy-coupling factor transport system ATP-binding protein
MLSQNPQTLFTEKTVERDLRGIKTEPEEMNRIIHLCKLENILDSHPYDLSGGEQQRAALAKVLLMKPEILLLDEPTKGLDAEYKQIFAGILRRLADEGVAIVIVSHDIEFCAEYADRCALFFDGQILAENDTRTFFGGNRFYTTGANRMARGILPWAVTVKDITLALNGDLP